MSNFTTGNLSYISSIQLAGMIKAKNPGVAIIDVRDNDFIGGHIIGCQNVPVHEHDFRMPELVRTLKDDTAVIFHCALSQQRGPSSALRYLREREKLLGENVNKSQKVYVLDGGFTKWQEKYGEDKELTEDYNKDLWSEDW